MTLQSFTQIGEVIRNAVVFDIKNWRASMNNQDSLIQSVQEFFSILEERKIKYVLVGGIALLNYVEGRNTQDLDLLMAVSSLKKLPELVVNSQDHDFAHTNYQSLQIDILLTKNALFKRVFQKYSRVHHFLDREIPIATVEGLLLLKLYALPSLYRQGNFSRVGIYENDIATLIHDYRPEISFLVSELSQYLAETDLREIKNILVEIENRITRFSKKVDEK